MMKYYLFFIQSILYLSAIGQINEGLTAEERAYLFHIVKKSEILDNNVGRYIEYKGPQILLPNKKINYDSTELVIMNQPDLLLIRREEIAKSPKGILAEISNKMAIWELNKVLMAKRISEKELENYKFKYGVFEAFLLEKLPESATKMKDGEIGPSSKLNPLLNPSLSFTDKTAFLESIKLPTIEDEKTVIDAISYAINEYVEKRSLEIFRSLGGEADVFENVLVAAGDGSSTSGLMDEREKDDKGRWNRGLPKAVGLFPYQTTLVKGEKKKDNKIETMRYATLDFETVGKQRYTNLHFDVWGYNAKKQTTVVIEKNGLSYVLFGAGDTRFLSPDSSFSEGTTFMAIINDLENNKIAKLKDKIYGKRGFDYWIDYNTKKKDETEIKIKKQEHTYSDLGYAPISTSKKAPRSVRKAKKKARKSGGGPRDYQPKTDGNRKEKRQKEQSIVDLYNQYEAYKKKIAELEKEKAEAIDLLAIQQQRLDTYKRLIGYRWAKYTEKDGLYMFEDSTTFDLATQEFRFTPTDSSQQFEVRLIAIPESSLSKQADEVMLAVNLTDAKPNYDARLQLHLRDVFASDSWQLERTLLAEKDSVAVLQLFETLLNKKMILTVKGRGHGIGKWNGNGLVKDRHATELKSYPGNTREAQQESRMLEEFVRLRTSEVFIQLNHGIAIEVNSYTDPVVSNCTITNPEVLAFMQRYSLSKNDLLSAYRSAAVLNALRNELNVLAGTYLVREQAAVVIDRLNREFAKARITIGTSSLKITDLK
jgi:hypothetical protein